MARLYLFGEGKTEVTFADLVLKPHLANFGVYLTGCIEVASASNKKSRHRGGGQSFLPMKQDLDRFLKQEKGADVFFTTMIDVYSIYSDFPGLEAAKKLNDPRKCVEALERSFAAAIDDERFTPYLQLHEYEAILFVDPSHFANRYERSDKAIRNLIEIAEQHKSPELINDGEQTAPSKRIIKEVPTYGKDKARVGPLVAQDIGLAAMRAKCPHFNDWLTRLEGLGVAPA